MNGWMNDGDSYNIDRIGHRRWLLNPKMAATGFGAVSGSNGTYSAVCAFDRGNTSASEYGVCWPAQNMPVEYFGSSFPWSVSTGTSENPANVKVTLTNRTTGKVWHFSASESDGAFYVNNDGYGQSGCIIFRPEGVSSYMDGDSYQVDITGLVNGDISYTVKFFNLYLKEVVINISNTWGLTYDGTDKQLSYSIYGNSNGFNKISDKKAEEIDHFKVTITKDGAPVSRICDAGDYVVTAEYNDGGYYGKKSQTISVAKANARITLGSLQQTEGKVSGAAASMTPASADASLTVEYRNAQDSSAAWTTEVPKTPGTYKVRAFLDTAKAGKNLNGFSNYDAAYNAGRSAAGTFVISHNYASDWTIDQAATCTSAGSKSHHCTVCGDKKDVTTISALGHTYGNWIKTKSATCTEKGEEQSTCAVCGAKETREIAALGHKYSDWNTTKAATCTEKGEKQSTCAVCGAKETREIAALSHNYASDWTIDQAATCTTAGSKSHHCTVCGDKKDVTTISALGHTYGNWIKTKSATCTEKGEEQKTCTVCGKQEPREIPALGHKFSSDWTTDKAATCKATGSKSHHCTRCDDKKDETTIPKTAHKYNWKTIKSATSKANGKQQGKCSVCGKTTTREIISLARTKISVSNKTYTGKKIKPAVTVKYGKIKLKANTDYTIKYGTNTATGKGTVTITGKGKYVGKVTKTFKILPRKTAVSLKSSSRGKMTISYTKKSEAVKYKIQYADNSKFKKATTKTVSAKTTKLTVSGKSGKYYYVRVSVVGKDGTDSGWSTVKKIKVNLIRARF